MAVHPRLRQNTDTSRFPIGHFAATTPVMAARLPRRQYPDIVDLRIAHAGREAR